MHGKYLVWSQSADVDKENTHQRLSIAGLKVETEGFTTVAQEQSRLIRNYQAKIIKNGAGSMSDMWQIQRKWRSPSIWMSHDDC